MADEQLSALPDGDYDVLVDTMLDDGHLTYGEYVHRGESSDEFLLSAHICHPSLANDNCSGLALLTLLAAALKNSPTRYTYRFLFAPGTIGAITWLARNEARIGNMKGGLVVSCVGDGGGGSTRRAVGGMGWSIGAMAHVLKHLAPSSSIVEFSPYGYDERQYCSPGFNLPSAFFNAANLGRSLNTTLLPTIWTSSSLYI